MLNVTNSMNQGGHSKVSLSADSYFAYDSNKSGPLVFEPLLLKVGLMEQ